MKSRKFHRPIKSPQGTATSSISQITWKQTPDSEDKRICLLLSQLLRSRLITSNETGLQNVYKFFIVQNVSRIKPHQKVKWAFWRSDEELEKTQHWYMSGETGGWHSPGRDVVAMNKSSAQSPLCFCNPCQGAVRHKTLGSLLCTCNSKTLQKSIFYSAGWSSVWPSAWIKPKAALTFGTRTVCISFQEHDSKAKVCILRFWYKPAAEKTAVVLAAELLDAGA